MANTLLDNLISHWSFDDTANDAHGSHNMTLVNSPSYVVASPGAWTKSLALNGSSQYCYTADHADWDALAGTGEWSVSFWVYHNGVSGTMYYMNDWSSTASDRSWVAYKQTTSYPRMRAEVSNVAKDADWGSTLTISTWYCIQVWRSGDTMYIDINDSGSPASVALGASASIDAWSNVLAFGARSVSPTGYYYGYVNGLSVWGADIGSTNRTQFYQSGSGLAYGSWTASGGSPTTLTPSVLASLFTVASESVVPTVSLTPSAVASLFSVVAPTLDTPATLTPAALASLAVALDATVSAGAVVLTPASVSSLFNVLNASITGVGTQGQVSLEVAVATGVAVALSLGANVSLETSLATAAALAESLTGVARADSLVTEVTLSGEGG